MINFHCEFNERLDLKVTDSLMQEFRPELFAFFRHLGLAHLVEEVWAPLCQSAQTKAAVAFEERPWPPKGVGAKVLRGTVFAVISDNRALLTPTFLSPQHVTNIGLASGLTKLLLEELAENGVDQAGILVNSGSQVVASEVRSVGFEPQAARVLSDGVEFVSFSAAPKTALEQLGIGDKRLGDVLSLNLDQNQVSRLTSFHLVLSAGISNYWAGYTQWTDVLPGLIDWAALPPGGIGGTEGPRTPSPTGRPGITDGFTDPVTFVSR